ncbi:MAG TPA: glycoside hydrolase family 3 N-terminal domain-containing protein [Gemmatimonadaceae bacterium]|nr:glycoside hydrolase family 3 N-terminal domain-containing protein [Gemmatimonadaceae bacterium]
MITRPLLVAALGIIACARGSTLVVPAPAAVAPQPTSVPAAVAPLADTSAWVEQTLAALTLRQRIAQMTMFWMLGDYTSVDDSTFREVVRWVQDEGVGGLTMSLGTPIEVAAKVNYLQRRARVPLLVSSDLEPALMRLEPAIFPHYLLETGGATEFPTAMAIAATGRDQDVFDVAQAIGREARAVGIHINFAPTVDVNVNPNNPVIGTRSFGEDPQRVARLSELFVRGTHAAGVLATAKHFPGHGDTDVDSHVGLPVVTADPARLNAVELVPFRAAINAGADLVMSAHIALPAFGGDSATPATLRRDVMQTLLRDSLGFRGITITDALSMEGVGKGYTIEESVVQAIRAGTDILLRPGDDVSRAITAVVGAVERGDIPAARIDSSVRRILWTKARVGLATKREVSLEDVRTVVATAEHLKLAEEVAQRALTMLRDSGATVPLPSGRVALIHYMPETELKAGRAFQREMTRLRPGARLVAKLSPATAQSQLDSIARTLQGADAIVIGAFVRRVEGEGRTTVPPHVAAWIDSVASGPQAAVIAFGNPYLIRQFPRTRTYINAYGVGDALEIAAARALAGAASISGVSPVSLPGFFKVGDGIRR